MSLNVVILGASDKPERYSYKALMLLREHGYHVVPVHPRLLSIEGLPVVSSLNDVKVPVDTLTLYLGKHSSDKIISDIVQLRPRRMIMNPGAENEALEQAASQAGIEIVQACTLVMLRTGQF